MLARGRAHYGSLPTVDDLLGAWALRRAAWTLNRFQPHKPNNMTSYQLLFGHIWRGSLLSFGETCLVKVDPDKLAHKFAQWWSTGMWAGFDDMSNGNLVLTAAGVVSSRSVRRLPPDEQKDLVV